MSEKPEALRLADLLNARGFLGTIDWNAAAELRRLHAENEVLLGALKEIAQNTTSEYEDAWCGDVARAAIAKAEGNIV